MSSTPYVTRAQANFVADFLYRRPKGYVWVDGPIADTGCIRIRHREGTDESSRAGREVHWNSVADRPLSTPLAVEREEVS
jgi:hypothetical protein